jgi:hypothetical protein
MTRALALLDADASDAAALELLMRRFHSFAGVSGLDTLDVLNSLGSRGEDDCRRLAAKRTAPTPEQLRRWRSILAVMRVEVEVMQRSAG